MSDQAVSPHDDEARYDAYDITRSALLALAEQVPFDSLVDYHAVIWILDGLCDDRPRPPRRAFELLPKADTFQIAWSGLTRLAELCDGDARYVVARNILDLAWSDDDAAGGQR